MTIFNWMMIVVGLAMTAFNLIILGFNLKIYTEFFKERVKKN